MRINFAVARLFLLLIFTTGSLSAQQREANVKMSFNVSDESGKIFSALKASDVQILQDKKTLPVAALEFKSDNRLEIVVMIDASASQEKRLPEAKKIAAQFIDAVLNREKDKIGIVKFAGRVSLEQDLTSDFAEAKKKINGIVFEPPSGYLGGGIIFSKTPPKIDSAGATSIWDSIKQVSDSLSGTKAGDVRRAIILISDGVNTSGDAKLNEAVQTSVKNQIPVYAVGVGDEMFDGVDEKTLNKLAVQTGGILIVPDKKLANLPAQIEKIAQNLRSNYQITFASDAVNSKDSLQEIKIRSTNPDLRKRKFEVTQPKGFFAAK